MKTLCLAALALAASAPAGAAPMADPARHALSVSRDAGTPEDVYGPLYRAVELAHVFPDGKTFADMIPRRETPQAIMAAYRDNNGDGDSLVLPASLPAQAEQGTRSRASGSSRSALTSCYKRHAGCGARD